MVKTINTKRLKIGPIGNAILGSIAVVGTVSILALFPGLTLAIAPFIKKKRYSPQQAIQRNIDSMIKNGLLKRTIDKSGLQKIELTKRGKWEACLRSNTDHASRASWDGVWRVVVFDVPQTKANVRVELRRAMKLFGFKMLQQSVWVYPFPCDDFIKIVKTYLGVSNDVLYVKANFIENDKQLRKEFSL